LAAVINAGTAIVTFLMVFPIQATQNRDMLVLQVKLDEVILATKNARKRSPASREPRTRKSRKRRPT
jgi:low affinity Fe/Cu permease